MELLFKLLLAHLLGDFVLQSDSFTKKKEKDGLSSYHLYLHALIHGLLSLVLIWDLEMWYIAVIITATHLLIDALKIKLTRKKNKRWMFTADQVAHLIVILILVNLHLGKNEIVPDSFPAYTIPLITCVVLLTSPVAIMLKVFFTRWKLTEKDTGIYGLKNAGRWIGIIERLLIFVFVITDNFSAVGLLLTAKSVFRFGDLSKAKNMKLTEYVLIGTLLSFGIAILTGLFFKNYIA